MTDLLERGSVNVGADDVSVLDPRASFVLGTGMRVVLAAASAGAAAIHFAMVPSHWGDSAVEGFGFALCGWLQLAFAVLVVARPSRLLLKLGIVLNLAAIGAWIVSRTAGLPFGAHSGTAESAGVVDVTCVAFEGLLVVLCAAALFPRTPARAKRAARGGLIVAIVAGIGVLGLTTAALASPGARNHAHAHDAGGTGVASDGHTHGGATPANDKGFSLLHNGQHEHTTMIHQLDAPTQRKLDAQLATTREVAAEIPTVAVALSKGYSRVGPYFPGIGAHYWKGLTAGLGGPEFNADGVIDDGDLKHPLMLIFNGTNPDSKIAGFMFYSNAPFEPTGFAGRNDTWHYHENLCIKMGPKGVDVPYGLDNSATKAQCDNAGGMMIKQSQYMVHVWTVPGYEMNLAYGGVFGEANPKLACADGTYYQLPIDEWPQHPMNVCRAQ